MNRINDAHELYECLKTRLGITETLPYPTIWYVSDWQGLSARCSPDWQMGDGVMGFYYANDNVIIINTHWRGYGDILRTLAHELLHCILHQSGQDYSDASKNFLRCARWLGISVNYPHDYPLTNWMWDLGIE